MKKERMVIADRFIGATVCAGVSVLLMTHYPDAWDGQVLNPVIALAKYVERWSRRNAELGERLARGKAGDDGTG